MGCFIMSSDFHILVAVDLKTGTEQLLAEAQRYGRALGAMVDIIHVAEPDPDLVGYIKSDSPKPTQEDLIRDDKAEALRSAHRQTQAIGAQLRSNGVRVDRALTVQGPILETILEHARKLDSNLLILGSHQHNARYRFWFGETAVEATKKAPCALLIIPVEPA
jgi:nucleotide-binding universal stress UspA family protein